MKLLDLVAENKADVLDQWNDLVLGTYPKETAKLWKSNKDRFTNPVGATQRDALDRLIDAILSWEDAQDVCVPLEEIVKIRAVQDFTPARALSFVFLFKKAVRKVLDKQIRKAGLFEDLMALDGRLDNVSLMGFDIYTKAREQVYSMRVQEYKRTHHMLFRKAGLVCEEPETDDGLTPIEPVGPVQDKER
jgi:hypothetical protein